MNDPMRDAYLQLIKDMKPNFALTLGAGLGCKPITFEGAARHFLNATHESRYGKHWAKRPPEDWIVALGFIEHFESNMHMHLVGHAPDDLRPWLCGSDARDRWKQIRKAGDFWGDVIDSRAKYSRYITKNLWMQDTSENVFVYAPRN